MQTIADIMTRDVIAVKRETSVRELAEIFTTRRIGSLPVVDDNNRLIGIVTETDLVEQDKTLHIPTVVSIFDWVIYLESGKRFEKELQKVTARTVGEIMNTSVEIIAPTAPISQAADIMTEKGIHAVPVVDGGKLVGIVSRIDLIRSMGG